MTPLEKSVLALSISGIIAAIVGAIVSAKLTASTDAHTVPGGTQQLPNTGSNWLNIGENDNYQMTPQAEVYNGPGNQQSSQNFNGSIYVKNFNRGGNHNSRTNVERSNALQTATKNPFANGTNNSYATAVWRATQDPTNQATALVLGPGIAPND